MPNATDTLARLIDDALARIWTQYPSWATYQGIHEHDHRLEDWSRESRASFLTDLDGLQARARAVDPDALPPDRRRDARLLASGLRLHKDELELLRRWEKNPGFYLTGALDSIYTLMVREFASVATRLAAIRARCAAIPRLLGQARENLVPEKVPPEFARYTLGVASGAAGLLDDALTTMAGSKVDEAQGALSAIRDYAAWVEREIVPHARGTFAIGREAFEHKLRNDHFLPYDAVALRALGEKVLRETRAQVEQLARDLGQTVPEAFAALRKDHPAPEGLLPETRAAMERARAFVRERGICSLPPGETLEVIETPSFMRPLLPYAAYMPPAPYERDQKGLFFVTVPEEEEALQGHDRAGMPITALHEGYPGHHLQFCWANRHPSKVRKEFWSTVYAEGWALYCEEMMYETGFYKTPAERLRQLKDVLWRAARVILDVDLAVGAMTFDQAVDFLVREAHVERPNAQMEVTRYCMEPTQPMSYVVGKLVFLELREVARARLGARFDLGRFHDAVLATATIPAPLAAEEVLERLS